MQYLKLIRSKKSNFIPPKSATHDLSTELQPLFHFALISPAPAMPSQHLKTMPRIMRCCKQSFERIFQLPQHLQFVHHSLKLWEPDRRRRFVSGHQPTATWRIWNMRSISSGTSSIRGFWDEWSTFCSPQKTRFHFFPPTSMILREQFYAIMQRLTSSRTRTCAPRTRLEKK
jgi:hypothetical protein